MIETKRLLIRRFAPSDLEAIFAMRRDAETMRYIGETHSERSQTEQWMDRISEPLDSEGIGYKALEERLSGETVGWCGLWKLPETGEIEVGYAIAKPRWGQGLATEAARAVVDNAFSELGLGYIVAVAYPENQGSINVMKKLGMSYVTTGVFYAKELVQYSVTAEEWGELWETGEHN